MYKYIQMSENSGWQHVEETTNTDEVIKSMGAVRSTALFVSEQIDDETDIENLKYKGPLYFDIDNSDLSVSILSTVTLVNRLCEMGVQENDIKLYCSGNKGFHIFIEQEVFFRRSRQVSKLPQVYKEMAKQLAVPGLDFSVYSAKRGRMFRPENGQHEKTGTYRVRIHCSELKGMTPESYRKLVMKPRDYPYQEEEPVYCDNLSEMYNRASRIVRRRTPRGGLNGAGAIVTENLVQFASSPPACIKSMVSRSDLSHPFNSMAMQLAIFFERSGAEHNKREELTASLALNNDSQRYPTADERKAHVREVANYVRVNPNMTFSCAAMRKYVGTAPCAGCPLDPAQPVSEEVFNQNGTLIEEPNGYFVVASGQRRRISTFVFRPVEVFMDTSQGGGTSRRIGTSMEIVSRGKVLGSVYFDESGWRSKAEMLRQIEGIKDLGFLGSDIDVQRIKMAVYSVKREQYKDGSEEDEEEDDEVESIARVYTAGIIPSGKTKAGKTVYTYVEPGLSINNYGIKGTHEVHGKIRPEPKIRMVNAPQSGDQKVRTILLNLMSMNTPSVMSQLLGWHSACHLKAHLMETRKQFPVLNLWGSAGSGKTMTSGVTTCLNGCDYYAGEGAAMPLSLTTAWPLLQTVSSTTTVPRILEEFNRASIKTHGMYENCLEVMKASWNALPVSRGRLRRSNANNSGRGGGEADEIPVTSPLLVCSEQAPREPAVQQRMVQIQLTNASRKGRREYFDKVFNNRDVLISMARPLAMTALKVDEDEISKQVSDNESLVCADINDRARYSYAVLLTGLDYFTMVTDSLRLNLDKEVGELKQAMLNYLNDNEEDLVIAKVWSEVDQLLVRVAEMASLGLSDDSQGLIRPGIHFLAVPDKDELLIDMSVTFPLLRMWAHRSNTKLVFYEMSQLTPLLRTEPYFVTDERVEPAMHPRHKLTVLRLSEMKKRGHKLELFGV